MLQSKGKYEGKCSILQPGEKSVVMVKDEHEETGIDDEDKGKEKVV